ncbi:MAG: ribonuclease D [Alphaproteobacteria bacterium]|nr:MAG: ribonuclease D [Alphaproteobacteria bacterium]
MPIITKSDDVAAFCKELSVHEFVTIDTEFLREKTYYPKLCLVQLSGPDKKARAIDPLVEGIDLSPLFELLANKNILKVFHSGRQDLEIFYNLTGAVVQSFFDTQIAAMVCGYGDSVGYENIVRQVSGYQVDKSSQFTNWSIRPLSDKQITYALGDVTHLCDVYLHLKAELEKRGRTEWVAQEERILNNPDTYANDPYKAWERIKIKSPKAKSLAVLRELAAWREMQAQKRDIPKTWVMRDDALSDMANQAPQNKNQLAKIRNVSKEMAEGKTGVQLLKVIAKGLETPRDTWPVPKRKASLSQGAMAMVDILKMLLKVQSAVHDVAPKVIASAADIEAIAQDDNADVPALEGWRKDVFGEGALAVKHGKLAIGLKDGKITVFKIADL